MTEATRKKKKTTATFDKVHLIHAPACSHTYVSCIHTHMTNIMFFKQKQRFTGLHYCFFFFNRRHLTWVKRLPCLTMFSRHLSEPSGVSIVTLLVLFFAGRLGSCECEKLQPDISRQLSQCTPIFCCHKDGGLGLNPSNGSFFLPVRLWDRPP